jgi:hypothetical protein
VLGGGEHRELEVVSSDFVKKNKRFRKNKKG